MTIRTAILVLAVSATSALAKPAEPAMATSGDADQVAAAFRDDMQAARADIIAKNVSLSADQAAKFWPLFEKYQAEQNAIIDAQIKAVQKYSLGYRDLSEADALAYMDATLERDASMLALRRKWLAEFRKVLPTKDAVRVMQIDRRFSNVAQVKLSQQVPLVR